MIIYDFWAIFTPCSIPYPQTLKFCGKISCKMIQEDPKQPWRKTQQTVRELPQIQQEKRKMDTEGIPFQPEQVSLTRSISGIGSLCSCYFVAQLLWTLCTCMEGNTLYSSISGCVLLLITQQMQGLFSSAVKYRYKMALLDHSRDPTEVYIPPSHWCCLWYTW